MDVLQRRYEQAVRESLLASLYSYRPIDAADTEQARRTIDFVEREQACAERDLKHGHLTGSAWIVNRGGDKVVLLHHRILGRWLQPGGHADGELNVLAVALREAREESGLKTLTPLSPSIFDLDIHSIPARKDEPAHLHYDLRYVIIADETEPFKSNHEAHSIAWFPIERVRDVTQEESVLRMCRKWQAQCAVTAAENP